ncbi:MULTISPECIES: serine--tRNA ligase [Prochlorococcus]|uniref:Serine--tRNA ligase n=1 Tax=Prochlorococcus marinus str. MIT 9116 TaxID=167544 RepID=A0A0A1ZWS6_PROMR|nr:serine--tRNA ligase [Prochlorococcus marinus]KGF91939.1 Seryl-tRNA synthetase [Prochlorococcus marinus str. MIT 9107]KGF93026.1 Seryl-tRNA synthetase [Prochlorococcus marinus str. MIT 9116]KGF94016.1 Seryl-tRNA synthetase [Prochlorococcus marinus str. MIT 9123]
MLDQKLIRENPTSVEDHLSLRGKIYKISHIHELTVKKKEIDIEISSLQSESKKLSKLIGQVIGKSQNNNPEELSDLKKKGNEYRIKISELEEKQRILDKQVDDEIYNLPNLPSKDAPIGKDESDNVSIKTWGDPVREENIKSHWEIGESLNIFESVKSTKISKSRFITLIGNGARLERALINFMIDMHTKNGYLELMPPALVNSESLKGSGQLPKFSNESFKCSNDDLWLSPTAEVPTTAFHRNEIIDHKQLPLKYVAYSPCFRREAGSYGRDTKGLIRLHQFNKVELYWFCDPSKSLEAHKKITSDAESILKMLDLPYRLVDICTGDLGFSSSRTFDLEVWLPSSKCYREISSCSNCLDFQARRSSIRTKIDKKNTYLHTLNGSGLAIGRTMAAILENCQQKDGSVKIPDALVPYYGSNFLKTA